MIEFEAQLGKPYQEGYVVLPVSYLKKAMEYTEKLSVIPVIRGTSDDHAQVKLLLIAIDMLRNKEKYKTMGFNAGNIAKLLGVKEGEVAPIIDKAKSMGFLKKGKNGNYIIKFKTIDEQEKGKAMSQQQFLDVNAAGRLYLERFLNKFKRETVVTPTDLKVIKDIVGKYDLNQLSEMFDMYFELQDEFLQNNGYSLRFFPNSVSKLISKKLGMSKKTSVPDTKMSRDYTGVKNDLRGE